MFTEEQVYDALTAVVEERGADYVYPRSEMRTFGDDKTPTCTYFFDDGRPGCIAGAAMSRLGVERDRFIEGKPVNEQPFADELEPAALSVLTTAQVRQDDYETWGSSIDY
jgi:hypothetical protein